jgi:Protein of unknown function (DUF3168)
MSYGAAAALQSAIFARLSGWAGLTGVSIVDEVPTGGGRGTFVLMGPEVALDRGDGTAGGAEHQLQISVISDAKGFLAAKTAAAAVSAALVGAPLTLTAGTLVSLGFVRANARRLEQGDSRRIDMTFRARIDF